MTTSVKTVYSEWIKMLEQSGTDLKNKCTKYSKEMAEIFPELRATSGWIVSKAGGKTEHWWTVDKDGNIYDPTVKQFSFEVSHYEEYLGPHPIGKCANCGDWVFETNSFCGGGACSEDCEQVLNVYYGR